MQATQSVAEPTVDRNPTSQTVAVPPDARDDFGRFLSQLAPGTTLQLASLTDVAESWPRLIEALEECHYAGVQLHIGDDRALVSDELFWRVIKAIADASRIYHSENTRHGLTRARRYGRTGGRKRSLSDNDIAEAAQLRRTGATVSAVCDEFGICKTTFYTWVAPKVTASGD